MTNNNLRVDLVAEANKEKAIELLGIADRLTNIAKQHEIEMMNLVSALKAMSAETEEEVARIEVVYDRPLTELEKLDIAVIEQETGSREYAELLTSLWRQGKQADATTREGLRLIYLETELGIVNNRTAPSVAEYEIEHYTMVEEASNTVKGSILQIIDDTIPMFVRGGVR